MSEFSQKPVSIAVCDDDPYDLEQIAAMTRELLQEENIACDIQTFLNADLLLQKIGGGYFQILILDVMMEGLDGMQLASILRQQGNRAEIIFISNNREMALVGYEVAAARYLAKPIEKEKLKEALQYCCRLQLAKKDILLPTAEGQRRVLIADVIYAEPWERGSRLVLVDGECKTGTKLSELERMLPKDKFALCHRTLLVNFSFIHTIRYCELTLKNGQVLPVSKYRQAQIKDKFLHYLRD